jgi:multidrug efflux pump subunit AcrA (membrane-fusion protein)
MHAPKNDTDLRLAARWGWPLPIMAGGDGEPEGEPKKNTDGEPEGKPKGDDKTVPLAELQAERRKRQDLEQRLQSLEAEREEARQAELSEAERLREQLSKAEARADKAEADLVKGERSRWIVDAAVEAGFDKPSAAARLIDDLEGIDSVDAAKRAVKDVAKEYPGLLRENGKGGPKLEQVLKDGQPPTGGDAGDEELLTKAELDNLSIDRHRELDEKHPGLVERSLAALGT